MGNSSSRKEHTRATQLQPKELPKVKEFNPFTINKVRSNGPFEYNHESNRSAGGIESFCTNQPISTQNNKSTNTTAILPFTIFTKDDFMRSWFLWKDEFLTYMKSIDQTEKAKQKWGIILLNRMGPIGQEIHSSFTFDKDHVEEDIDILLKNFDFYCKFGSRRRRDEEIDIYVNGLMVMVLKHGNTKANTDQMIKEKILMEIDKDKFTKKAKSLIQSFSFPSSVQTLTIKEMTYIWMSCENADFKQKQQFVGNNLLIKNCNYCGGKHKIKNCPAYGKKCNNCNNKNHFERRCPSQYIDNCLYCGEGHFLQECIAYANICNNCHKPNHFSWKCSVEKVLNCNFCGLTHIASKSKCPAINSFCTKCKRTGHFPSKCKWRN